MITVLIGILVNNARLNDFKLEMNARMGDFKSEMSVRLGELRGEMKEMPDSPLKVAALV